MSSTPKADKNGYECEPPGSAEHTSGHRGSLRGANKLARRARSFKDDLIERISMMRSPGQNHHSPHLANVFRSHPISPKIRTPSKLQENNGEITPAKELEQLVREVQFELIHFCDVIKKNKLEMLPGNGTIVFDTVSNIHNAIKPYASRSGIASALTEVCTALSDVLKLCDEAVRPTDPEVLRPEKAHERVQRLLKAVKEACSLACIHMTSRPALAPRPPLVTHRAHRNSLPDIPLTERERAELCASGVNSNGIKGGSLGGDVRAAHSTESVLDPPDAPAKPPLPHHGNLELAPPLPPKRRHHSNLSSNDNSLLNNSSGVDSRLSLQSHSSGSLDSLLNASHDDEVRAIMDASKPNNNPLCSCASEESLSCVVTSSGDVTTSHNRFSAESGFVSMGKEMIHQHHVAATAMQQHTTTTLHSSSMLDTTDCVFSESKSLTLRQESSSITTYLHSEDGSEEKPALPTKTRRPLFDPNTYPGVELRSSGSCAIHGARHTLAAQRPPPLPLKKKHIMAYMQMFGNCSHSSAMAEKSEVFRHSIHVSNMSSGDGLHGGIAQSLTLHHFATHGSRELNTSSSSTLPSRDSSPEPPALPPKMNKIKPLHHNIIEEIEHLPTLQEVRSLSCNSDHSIIINSTPKLEEMLRWSSPGPGKFPLDDELEIITKSTPSPLPPIEHCVETPKENGDGPRSESSASNVKETDEVTANGEDDVDIMLECDVTRWLLFEEDGTVRGGHPHALVVLATKPTRDFAYQEAFITTYRTWIDAGTLVRDLCRRAKHLAAKGPTQCRSTLSLLTRVTADLMPMELDEELLNLIIDFVYWVIESGELTIGKAMRLILLDKYRKMQEPAEVEPCIAASLAPVSLRRETLLEFKAQELAIQMTLLDAELFAAIEPAELLIWRPSQLEERSPNLTRFTEHFNKMSYWARSRILEKDEPRDREKIATKFLKVMKALRKMNNFNSYLALIAALDSAPVRRLGWSRTLKDAVKEHASLIDSSGSFRAYRDALAQTQPPAIPYIGIILQDLTFVHSGNPDHLPEGGVNFSKRWQQYNIMENMKRFHNVQYQFRKNERVIAMFNGFDDALSDDTLWQISETIKPKAQRRQEPMVEAAA